MLAMVPHYLLATAFVLGFGVVSAILEIDVVMRVLRRGGIETTGFKARLWAMETSNWFILVAIAATDPMHSFHLATLGGVALTVVLFEAALFSGVLQEARYRDDRNRPGIAFTRALLASALGNMASMPFKLAMFVQFHREIT